MPTSYIGEYLLTYSILRITVFIFTPFAPVNHFGRGPHSTFCRGAPKSLSTPLIGSYDCLFEVHFDEMSCPVLAVSLSVSVSVPPDLLMSTW